MPLNLQYVGAAYLIWILTFALYIFWIKRKTKFYQSVISSNNSPRSEKSL